MTMRCLPNFAIHASWIGLSLLIQLHVCLGIILPTQYDTIWDTQSSNSADSMPMGGGSVGLNVWAESAHSGAFDENNSLLKLGRVRLRMQPNPFALNATQFEQRLHINEGYISFTGDNNTVVHIWVDVETSNIHVNVTAGIPVNLTASYENWRTTGWQMVEGEQRQTSWGVIYVSAIPLPKQYPDIISFVSGGVLSYHHNTENPLFAWQIPEQNLSHADPWSFYNPMTKNTFGAYMTSPQLRPGGITEHLKYQSTNYTAYHLVSPRPSTSYQLYVAIGQNQTTEVDKWSAALVQSAASMPNANRQTTVAWWRSFWDRSHIIINPDAGSDDEGFQVGKNYQYFRFMMGCNAGGKFPTRFNGGLFTFDPVLVSDGAPWSPDYRKWSGGTYTAQNQRLLLWPLLKSGDFDILSHGLDFYKNITPNSRRLGQLYFGLDVALTSEQIDNTGLPNVYEYNAKYFDGDGPRTALYPPGIVFGDYLSWLSDTANEFADIAVLSQTYGGLNIDEYMPFVEYQLAWFDEFYQMRNGLESNGSLILYPASGAETYKLALNPSSTISGLRRTVMDILLTNPNYVKGNRSYYEGYLSRIPATPLHPCPGASELICISPAVNYSTTVNSEPTAMYPVFPWSEYGLGQPTNLSYAMHAYFNDSQSAGYHGTYGWRQDQIWWARMGLTELAKANTISRLSDSTTYRFPTFKGPNYDWSPDINHYGSAAIGLQEMLMQTFARNNTQIRLLPAWPSDWTGYFKLLAPSQTTVSGNLTGGSVVDNLVVEPANRRQDIVYGTD
ncbi:hypothetical protein AtubIFM57258_005895 [Aspergillus tubingensis]|nr:hypothetical protein AtubIFM57258_005895 [Aspergillus tubingensis]